MDRLAIATRREIAEHLDDPTLRDADLARNLIDLRLLNRVFGGHRYAIAHLARLLRGVPRGSRVRVLDAGAGGGDTALALVAWGRRRGLAVQVVGVDVSPAVVAYARAAVAAEPAVTIEHADVLAMDLPDRAFDVCLTSLTLHHLARPQAIALLGRLDRASRRGFVVLDLVRTWPAYAGVWLASRALSAPTRHDAPASVLRAYTLPELRAMVAESGVRGVRMVTHPFFRVALVKEHP